MQPLYQKWPLIQLVTHAATQDVFSVMQVYKGYVDDSRNTDNAWIETTIITLHCDKHTPLMADLNRIVSRKYHFHSYRSDFCTI